MVLPREDVPGAPQLDPLEQVQEGERFDLTVGGRRVLLGHAVRMREGHLPAAVSLATAASLLALRCWIEADRLVNDAGRLLIREGDGTV
ncbi:uncharacterized protein SOCE26_043260 [Sorangium cellulosum]|uniref:Uncharacterized protein n=1 Tax=Sorangium cellulosum TaxID=56 RepID=A0A2L0EUA2_SORCE|nr:hypothetical protein [Sorangium cellulosum]AUX42888.1 uncharacterized protein SOCE26_043260 [Sorangium cellulosum]